MLNQDNRRLGQADEDEYAFDEQEDDQYSQDNEHHYGK
jgi:hypothetical protein